MMELDGKSCFNIKKIYFDQPMACRAPVAGQNTQHLTIQAEWIHKDKTTT